MNKVLIFTFQGLAIGFGIWAIVSQNTQGSIMCMLFLILGNQFRILDEKT